MSNIDKLALREAAEKALPAMQRLLMMPNDELFDEALLNVDGDVDAANAFNLLTGPETVLALLDELEAKEKRNADLEGLLEAEVRLWTQRYDCANSRREVAEKRIAEQKEVMRQAASDISYAIFNLTGSDLSRLQPGVVETTDPTDTALIAERNLRAAAAGKGE
ncbi:TPA: ead/Ea22-like family protein [Enterobacter hormaechei]|nr:ead/Ea22-like family protein [Enterobacter hormaechei]